MRLIDADMIDFREVFDGAPEFAKDMIDGAQSLINRQPTAYDVDKTVRRLEEEYLMCRCKSAERCTYPENIGCCYDRAIKNAVDIVRSGGIAPEIAQSKDGKYMHDRESFFKE